MSDRENPAFHLFFAQLLGEESGPLVAGFTHAAAIENCWRLLQSSPYFDEVMRMREVLADESLSDAQCVAVIERIAADVKLPPKK